MFKSTDTIFLHFLNKYKIYPKKWRLKNMVYFCCLFGPQVFEKASLSLKKLVIMCKYVRYWFQNGVVYITILSYSEVRRILVKSLKIEKWHVLWTQTVEILRSLQFNVKHLTYYFHIRTKILADFQICSSVPLTL